MSISSLKTMHCFEDKVMKGPGLYGMWTALYITVISCLAATEETGSARDFLLYTSMISTLFPAFSSANTIYGNRLSSSMLLVVGPIYQYTFWQLLCYYRGDVYNTTPVGIMNAIGTGVTGVFTLDMVVKTWYYAIYPKDYSQYKNAMNQ